MNRGDYTLKRLKKVMSVPLDGIEEWRKKKTVTRVGTLNETGSVIIVLPMFILGYVTPKERIRRTLWHPRTGPIGGLPVLRASCLDSDRL